MRSVPEDVENSPEFGPADEHVQNLFRELRGQTIRWWPHETAADAVQRAAFRRHIKRPVPVIAERLDGAAQHQLAIVIEHEAGGGTVTFPELPPTVAAARAKVCAEREARRTARRERVGRQGGFDSTGRSDRARHPERYVDVPRGKPGRPSKTVAGAAAETIAGGAEKTVAPPATETAATVFPGADSAPFSRAIAGARPPTTPLSGGVVGGSDRAEQTVATTPATAPRKPVAPSTVWTPTKGFAELDDKRMAAAIYSLWSRTSDVLTTDSNGVALARRVKVDRYNEHDLAVIGWHWESNPSGALERLARRLGVVRLARLTVADLATHLSLLPDEHCTAQQWWRSLPAPARHQIEAGARPRAVVRAVEEARPGPVKAADAPPTPSRASGEDG